MWYKVFQKKIYFKIIILKMSTVPSQTQCKVGLFTQILPKIKRFICRHQGDIQNGFLLFYSQFNKKLIFLKAENYLVQDVRNYCCDQWKLQFSPAAKSHGAKKHMAPLYRLPCREEQAVSHSILVPLYGCPLDTRGSSCVPQHHT